MRESLKNIGDFVGAMLVVVPIYILARRTGIDSGAIALSVIAAFGVRLMIWANR